MNIVKSGKKSLKLLSTKNLLILCVFGLIALFIIKSDVYVKTTFQGIVLWATTVLPSLLPFFFLTAILTKTINLSAVAEKISPLSKFLYNAQGIALFVRIMSLLSGYPIGAKLLRDLYENRVITDKQVKKYCTFTSTSGPLFIVGAVGVGMFNDKLCGFVLLASHVLSSLLVGVVFRKMPDNGHIEPLSNKKVCNDVLYESIYSSVVSVAVVGGLISIFYTISSVCNDLMLLYPLQKILGQIIGNDYARAFTCGLIECTKGALMLSKLSKNSLSLSLTCALISFGGLSVWFQSFTYLKKCNVKFGLFLISKLLHGIFAFIICYAVSAIL